MGLKMKKWLTNSQFELREASALRQSPSRSFEALVGEHLQRQTQLTPESAPLYSLLHRRNLNSVCSKVCSLLHRRFKCRHAMLLPTSVAWRHWKRPCSRLPRSAKPISPISLCWPPRTHRITGSAFQISFRLDWQIDNGFFKRPIMARTQILVHKWRPRAVSQTELTRVEFRLWCRLTMDKVLSEIELRFSANDQ